MCAGYGCRYTTYDGGCSYRNGGCYLEKKDTLQAERTELGRRLEILYDVLGDLEDRMNEKTITPEQKMRLQEEHSMLWKRCDEMEEEYEDMERRDPDDVSDWRNNYDVED